MKLSLKTLLCAALLCVPAAQAETVWAKGVSVDGGWYDANKSKTNEKDNNLCWAATCSNIIDFWQQRYIVPSGTPTGGDIWTRFIEACINDVGGNFPCAMQWWIGGDYQGTTWTTSVNGAENNRCVYTAVPDEDELYPIYTDISTFDGYYWDAIPDSWVGQQYYNTNAKHSHLENFLWSSDASESPLDTAIVNQFSEGMPIALSLASTGGSLTLAHAVTLWGVEYTKDANENITLSKLWLTDSDDYTTRLQSVSVKYGTDGESIWLTDYTNNTDYGHVYLGGATGINVSESDTWNLTLVPEPATATLSLLALAGLAVRRRRK